MHQLQRSWVRSQHPSAQWNLRGGRWSSAEYCMNKKKKIPQKIFEKKKINHWRKHQNPRLRIRNQVMSTRIRSRNKVLRIRKTDFAVWRGLRAGRKRQRSCGTCGSGPATSRPSSPRSSDGTVVDRLVSLFKDDVVWFDVRLRYLFSVLRNYNYLLRFRFRLRV